MVESVTDYAIVVLDPQGRVVSWNSGAQRIKGYASDEIVGSGLGLAMVKGLANLHGGTAWADSEPGKGSTFYLALPVVDNGLNRG